MPPKPPAHERAGTATPRSAPIIKRTLKPCQPHPPKVLCLHHHHHDLHQSLPTNTSQPLPSVHLATGFPAPILPPSHTHTNPTHRHDHSSRPPPRKATQGMPKRTSPHLEDFRREMLVPVFRRSTYAAEMRKQASSSTQAKVVFVDEGNHCRSILAEAIFRTLLSRSPIRDQVAVESASLGPCYGEAYDDAVVAIAKVGVESVFTMFLYTSSTHPPAHTMVFCKPPFYTTPTCIIQPPQAAHVPLPPRTCRVFDECTDIVDADLVLVMDDFDYHALLREVSVFDAINPDGHYSERVKHIGGFAAVAPVPLRQVDPVTVKETPVVPVYAPDKPHTRAPDFLQTRETQGEHGVQGQQGEPAVGVVFETHMQTGTKGETGTTAAGTGTSLVAAAAGVHQKTPPQPGATPPERTTQLVDVPDPLYGNGQVDMQALKHMVQALRLVCRGVLAYLESLAAIRDRCVIVKGWVGERMCVCVGEFMSVFLSVCVYKCITGRYFRKRKYIQNTHHHPIGPPSTHAPPCHTPLPSQLQDPLQHPLCVPCTITTPHSSPATQRGARGGRAVGGPTAPPWGHPHLPATPPAGAPCGWMTRILQRSSNGPSRPPPQGPCWTHAPADVTTTKVIIIITQVTTTQSSPLHQLCTMHTAPHHPHVPKPSTRWVMVSSCRCTPPPSDVGTGDTLATCCMRWCGGCSSMSMGRGTCQQQLSSRPQGPISWHML